MKMLFCALVTAEGFKEMKPAGILSETMQDINIYVFDGSDRLLDILPIRSLEPVILSYPGIPSLHCIALFRIKYLPVISLEEEHL